MRSITLLLLLLALLAVAGSVTWTGRASDRLREDIQKLQEELPEMATRTSDFTVWRTSDGLKLDDSVTTTRGEFDPDETAAEWAERHRATVEAAVQNYLDNGYQLTPPPQPQ